MSAQPNPVIAAPEHVGRTCPYCRFAFKEGVQAIECGSCHALHHLECWQDNQGCAVMGCPSAPATHPRPPSPPVAPLPPPSAPLGQAGIPAMASGFQGAPPPPPPSAPVPTAAEFAVQIRSWLQTPTAVAVGSAALLAFAVMVVVGFATAVITPDNSSLGGAGGSGLFKEIVRDVVATTQARYGFSSFHFALLPITFIAVPLVGAALGSYRAASRIAGLSSRQRLIAGAATGVPLSALVVLLAAFGGANGSGFASGSAIFYCLLWGGIGGSIGAARAAGPGAVASSLGELPPAVLRWARLVATAGRSLLVLLLLVGVAGVIVWEVQILRNQQNAKGGRTTVTAVAETPFLVGQYAIEGVALGAFAQFQLPGDEGAGSLPLPPNDKGSFAGFSRRYRIFAYHHAYPDYAYIFILIFLFAATLAFAAYAGYATAIAAGAVQPWAAIGYGALVGVVWAPCVTILRTVADERFIVGDSLFVSVLLVGVAAGAAGGLLASSRRVPAPV
jgi:hypothetical protein